MQWWKNFFFFVGTWAWDSKFSVKYVRLRRHNTLIAIHCDCVESRHEIRCHEKANDKVMVSILKMVAFQDTSS